MLKWFILGLLLITGCDGDFMEKESSPNMTEYVTKACGTEPAFKNAYWNEHRPGIYIDVNTGEALFNSKDKFDSGTGWPSFTKPIENTSIEEKPDSTLGMQRIEVRTAASHLGHVFNDGPNGELRYCINSASLKFISYEELAAQGYERYEKIFPYEKALLAGGCFWGVEKLLADTKGVISAISGYTGGKLENPTYTKVSTESTGHAEAVLVVFDPKTISYKEILDIFWRLHDPTQENRQGVDIGTQYRSAIFYFNDEQKNVAELSKKEFDAKKIFSKPTATQIVPAGKFYAAEEYHQDYYEKNPDRVCHALREE
jgi:peptide methionine sulfoxide reductase msrA/msrB